MSSVFYIASDKPLKERTNPHDKMVSVNEAVELGYENIPEFMLKKDFDRNKPGVLLVGDREVKFDIDTGVITDGDFDDDFSIWLTEKSSGMRTDKAYCAIFECIRLTTGRAEQLIDYIKEQLSVTDEIELWHVCLDNEPEHKISRQEIRLGDLKSEDIFELEQKKVYIEPCVDYCYRVVK